MRTQNRGVVTVRLAGIDTPERGQGYWRVARSHLLAAAGTGKVTIACYKTDRYEREVCRVATPAGDLAASLLTAGLGWHDQAFAHEQRADERKRYAQLERAARERRLGLWKEANPMDPAICRKTRRSGGKCQ